MILDTCFLIDLLKGRKEAVALSERLEIEELTKITSVSVFEISRGIKAADRLESISQLFDSLIILDGSVLLKIL